MHGSKEDYPDVLIDRFRSEQRNYGAMIMKDTAIQLKTLHCDICETFINGGLTSRRGVSFY